LSGPQADRRPARFDGDPVCVEDRDRLGASAQGALGCGSGMTCWRRLHEWQQQGVWQQLHETLLAKLREADKLDWSRAVVDSSFLPALKGAPKPVRARPTGANRAVSTT